jgi:hypothetical protein
MVNESRPPDLPARRNEDRGRGIEVLLDFFRGEVDEIDDAARFDRAGESKIAAGECSQCSH